MELRHLRYFAAIVHEGTASGAATRLYVTQPSLSRQVRALESELGVRLFERANGRLTLSRSGQALLPLVRDILERTEALRIAAAIHGRGRLESVTIGVPTVTFSDVVGPFIAGLQPDDPVADVFLSDGLRPVEMLQAGADLAIGTQRPSAPYEFLPLAVQPVWAYVPARHPWAGRKQVTLTELLAEPLISLPSNFTSRESLDNAVVEAGEGFTSLLVAANGAVAQALAASGRGIAVVSDDPRYGVVPVMVDLGHRLLSIRLFAAWDSRHPGIATLAALAARIGEFVRWRYRDTTLAISEADPTVTVPLEHLGQAIRALDGDRIPCEDHFRSRLSRNKSPDFPELLALADFDLDTFRRRGDRR
jgi:DNA-binding transcriptional LysR family regulator